jgi:hypothetical protein
MRTKALIWLPVILLALCYSAAAQEYPKYEFSGGYFYSRLGGQNWKGWMVEGAKNLSPVLGIMVDVGRPTGTYTLEDSTSAVWYQEKNKMYTIMGGPQFTYRGPYKLIPFGHFFMGATHTSSQTDYNYDGATGSYEDSGTHFSMGIGGGMTYDWVGPLVVRGQMDYMGYRSSGYWFKGIRMSIGLTLKIGKVQ